MFWANCWVFFERTLNEWLRYIVGTFWSNLWKNPLGFFKEELMGSLMGSFKTYSQLTHWSHQDQSGEYIENLLTIYPLGKVWVNRLKTLNKLSMYLPGKTPSAPSDRRRGFVETHRDLHLAGQRCVRLRRSTLWGNQRAWEWCPGEASMVLPWYGCSVRVGLHHADRWDKSQSNRKVRWEIWV